MSSHRLTVGATMVSSDSPLGASISVNGCCLTVVENTGDVIAFLASGAYPWELLVTHRPASLRGRSLAEALPLDERRPAQLASFYRASRGEHRHLREAAPTLAFAVIGQARGLGLITPEDESRTVGNLLTYWALRSTLDIAEICAAPVSPPSRREQRLLQTHPL